MPQQAWNAKRERQHKDIKKGPKDRAGPRTLPKGYEVDDVVDLLRREFPALDEVFIQPASKDDPLVQQRVRERYGHDLADR